VHQQALPDPKRQPGGANTPCKPATQSTASARKQARHTEKQKAKRTENLAQPTRVLS